MNEEARILSNLKQNLSRIRNAKEVSLPSATPPEGKPGVYMLFFERKLQYVGSSARLGERIKQGLLLGIERHTLIKKLCALKGWNKEKAMDFLKRNSIVKFLVTEDECEAKLMEVALVCIHRPYWNEPLRRLRKLKG